MSEIFAQCAPPVCPDCGRHFSVGDWPFACAGLGHEPGSFWTGDAQIHASEKVVVNRNVHTGQVSIPGRADRPLHPRMAAAGYVRETLDTHTDVKRIEKETGTMHEAGSYLPHSSQALKDTGSL